MEQKILNFKIISSVNKPHALLLVKSIIKAVSGKQAQYCTGQREGGKRS